MKKLVYIIIGLVVVVALGAWLFWLSPNSLFFFPTSSAPEAQEPYMVPLLGETYTNDTYHFSLTLPEGFEARSMKQEVGETIVFENGSGDGIQIIITPFDEDLHVLTKERVQADVPGMQITDAQPVEIGDPSTGSGQVYYQGLAFKSDNPAFDGASREVWFVFRGNLYQISTYERLDELLKKMFSTWKFF